MQISVAILLRSNRNELSFLRWLKGTRVFPAECKIVRTVGSNLSLVVLQAAAFTPSFTYEFLISAMYFYISACLEMA